MSSLSLEFDINKYMLPLYTEDYYEADVCGGRGRGGSHGITQHCVQQMITQPYFRGYFVRSVQGYIRDSLWQDFKDRIDELSELNNINLRDYFRLNESRMEGVFLPNGNTVKSKGFKASSNSNTAHMKSIAGATHIYGEEWEEVGEEENNKLMDSLRTTKGQIRIIRSWNPPPKEHWLIKNYFELEPTEMAEYFSLKPKEIPGHIALIGDYTVNAENIDFNTQGRYERYRQTFPKYYWTQIKGYVASGGDKRVYFGWQKISYQKFLSIDGAKAYGLDFGDTAPCSLTLVKYKDGCFYRHLILYESLRSLSAKYSGQIDEIRKRLSGIVSDNEDNNIWTKHKGIMTLVFDMLGIEKNTVIFADPSQKSLILELRHAGYTIVTAKKEKEANINFINRANNFYTDTSHDLEAEYSTYYLDEDINKNPIDGKPKAGQPDHAMDSQEYGCRGLKDLFDITL